MSAEDVKLRQLGEVVAALLEPESGCPWDKEQTPSSLSEYLIEETHELVDAVRHGTVADVCEEMGDVFFLLVFISQLYASQGLTLEAVLAGAAEKMIRRHPHVFAGTELANREALYATWEQIKKTEKAADNKPKGVFDSLPSSLPPLVKAYRIHAKAARAGFTWDEDQDVEMQIESEWLEVLDALQQGETEKIAREFGDLLFSIVELARRKGVKANEALDFTNERFLHRFARMEDLCRAEGKEFPSVSMEEKNLLWDKVKAEEQS